ncbi:MAG: hypothetical protein Q9172_003896 [Xanthocarpia lactea]
MTSLGWPEAPDLGGRPLDTALLLNRDYQLQIHNRLNASANAEEACVPFHVFHSFCSNTEPLIVVLCDHSKIQRFTLDFPTIEPGPGMPAQEWPQAPELHGRLLDTALLLSRDYTNQLRRRVRNDHENASSNGVPTDVWCPFSKNIETLIKALCHHGKIQLNSLNSIPKLKDATNPPEEPRRFSETVRRQPVRQVAASRNEIMPMKVEGPQNPKTSGNILEDGRRKPAEPVAAPARGLAPLKFEEPSGSEGSDHVSDITPDTLETSPRGISNAECRNPRNRQRNANSDEERKNGVPRDQANDEMDTESDDGVSANSSVSINEDEASENHSKSDSGSNSDSDEDAASDSSTAGSATAPLPPLHDRPTETQQVIVKLDDPETTSKLRKLTPSQLTSLVQGSIRQQRLDVTVKRCQGLGKKNNLHLWTTGIEGARLLKEKWNVKLVKEFGRRSHVQGSTS